MVAAGCTEAECNYSYGGNGGTTEGCEGISAVGLAQSQYSEVCKGAKQAKGVDCPSRFFGQCNYPAYTGEFGSAGFVEATNDYGAFGGGGYYGGSSYPYGFAGSGGSSFYIEPLKEAL